MVPDIPCYACLEVFHGIRYRPPRLGLLLLCSATMARARESWKKSREEDADETPCSTILLGSSSDDEEANGDLSAWIVERSKKREEERSAARRTIDFIEIDSSDDLEITSVTRGKKKKKKLKKKCKGAGGDHETVDFSILSLVIDISQG